jgi:hypothetical protein
MGIESQIKLRQLDLAGLSGFLQQSIFPILSGSGLNISTGNILPNSSGLENLGSLNFPFNQVYTNGINIPSGNSINFGNTPLTAFTSGGFGIVNVGGYNIISNNQALLLIGPSGPSGLQGIVGPTGVSGIGITGISGSGTLSILLSNGSYTNSIILPSGEQGPTGVSTTGYFQSGSFISPLFSNGTTGNSMFIPSGGLGPQGTVGNVYIDFGQMTGFLTGSNSPSPYVILNIDPSITESPDIRLVKGMNYGFGYSGLNLSQVSGYQTNYFIDDYGITGYLRFTIFDTSSPVGRFVNGEAGNSYSFYSSLIRNGDVMINTSESLYKNEMSFNVDFTASDSYMYGFQRYTLANGQAIDDNVNAGEWGFYILGELDTNYFGPPGPAGPQGVAGIPGAQGNLGPAGNNGPPGVSITGINLYNNNIQFLYTDGTLSQWINLPSGGPTGPMGPTGPQGLSGQNGIQGMKGETGSQGIADTYFAEFYPNDMVISGFTGFYKQVSGSSTWLQCTTTGRVLSLGDKIWFTTPSLVGKAYSPWQNIIFADDNFNTARYFYASVVSFNQNNGEIQCVANQNPSPAGLVGGQIQLYNYSLIDVNLGGLGSSGAVGPIGPQGLQGNTGYSIFQNSSLISLPGNSGITINPGTYDSWNFTFTGLQNTIDFYYPGFATGQTVIIKIKNTGNYYVGGDINPAPDSLIVWDSAVSFPYQAPAPAPNPGYTALYTFIRFPTTGSIPLILSTFSYNYPI